MDQPQATPPLASSRRRLGGLSWAHFLNDGAANYLPGILPALLVDLNLSVALAGAIMTALLIGQGLQPLVGLIGDRIGGRGLIVAGLFGSSIGGALISVVDSVALLFLVLLLIGVSNACFHPQALTSVRELGGRNRGTAMSVFLVGGEIGRGVWPLLAGWAVASMGRSWLWMLAVPALFTLPLLWHWAPSLPARRGSSTRIQWHRHAGPLSLLVAFCALRALMTFAVITFVPLLWVSGGGSLTGGASFITILMVVGVIGNLAGGRIGDSRGTRPVLVGAMLAASVLMLLFLQLNGLWLWLVLAMMGIALFATLPLTVLIAQHLLPENPSFGAGMALGLANALGAVCLMALGPVADSWGPSAALWVAAGCGLTATLLALAVPRYQPGADVHHASNDERRRGQ